MEAIQSNLLSVLLNFIEFSDLKTLSLLNKHWNKLLKKENKTFWKTTLFQNQNFQKQKEFLPLEKLEQLIMQNSSFSSKELDFHPLLFKCFQDTKGLKLELEEKTEKTDFSIQLFAKNEAQKGLCLAGETTDDLKSNRSAFFVDLQQQMVLKAKGTSKKLKAEYRPKSTVIGSNKRIGIVSLHFSETNFSHYGEKQEPLKENQFCLTFSSPTTFYNLTLEYNKKYLFFYLLNVTNTTLFWPNFQKDPWKGSCISNFLTFELKK